MGNRIKKSVILGGQFAPEWGGQLFSERVVNLPRNRWSF